MLVLREESGKIGVKPSERSTRELLRYGAVILDKPRGPSSHETSAFVRKILGVKKAGHSGTLDPNVSGVLPVLLEDACKAAGFLLKQKKSYACIARFSEKISETKLREALARFRGKIYQTPPLESAVAKRLRVREVYSLNLLEVDGRDVLFECEVEGGFYIRKLVFDLGEVLGMQSEMLELRRANAAGFSEGQCTTLQDLADRAWFWKNEDDDKLLREVVLPVEEVIFLKRVVASDRVLHAISTGANLGISGILSLDAGIKCGESVQVLSGKGELVCFAQALLSSEEIDSQDKETAFDVTRVIQAF